MIRQVIFAHHPYLSPILVMPLIIILIAFTQGPPDGYTGSPLDEKNCTECHLSLPPGNLPNWITTDIPAYGYTPGETYTITLTANGIVAVKMGFQITSETAGAKAGAFIITDALNTQLAAPQTVTHTTEGSSVKALPYSRTMEWQAPAAGTGDVTFFAIVNQSDNNNNSSGDLFYASQLIVSEASVSTGDFAKEPAGNIFPNPAGNTIHLKLPLNAGLRIFNQSGLEVLRSIAENEYMEIAVGHLAAGTYYLVVYHEGKRSTKVFIRK
jgi:hypothetical protein